MSTKLVQRPVQFLAVPPQAKRPKGSTQALDHTHQAKRIALRARLVRGFCDPVFNVPFSMLMGYVAFQLVLLF